MSAAVEWGWVENVATLAAGGALTLLGQWVAGRRDDAAERRRDERDDRHRKEDEATEIRRFELQERSQLYLELLEATDELFWNTLWLHTRDDHDGAYRDGFADALRRVRQARERAFLRSVDEAVPTLVTEVMNAAVAAAEAPSEDDESVEVIEPSEPRWRMHLRDMGGHQTELRAAMRRDLGLPSMDASTGE